MADKGVWIKTIGGLKPADSLAEETYASLPLGTEVFAEVSRPRSLGHHKKLFALCKIIRDNQDFYKTTEQVLDALKVAVGHCYPVKLQTGVMMVKTKSISFAKMDQLAFQKFWDAVVEVVVTKFLPGVDKHELEAEIMSMVEPR
jgi:hypothetical protein